MKLRRRGLLQMTGVSILKIPESRGRSRAAAASKMERFVIIVNCWKSMKMSYVHISSRLLIARSDL